MQTVSRERLRERTAAELRDYVLANRLAPGTQLPPEPALAERLGVSRNILRQAVASLEGLGMLKVAHGSGTYVADPADSEVFSQIAAWMGADTITESDYLEVRGIWERGVYALVMQQASDAELDRLEALGAALATAVDPAEVVARHEEFHHSLLRLTGNPFLVTIGTILARFFWEFGYRNAPVRKPPEGRLFAAHHTIAAVLRERDPARLQHLVDLHLSPALEDNRAGNEHDQATGHPPAATQRLGPGAHHDHMAEVSGGTVMSAPPGAALGKEAIGRRGDPGC